MVVVCPGCRTVLSISKVEHGLNTRIFKCPQCRKIFVLKKCLTQTEKGINQGKILVAHSDQAVMDKITSLLDKSGYQSLTSSDGITAILKVIKESPFLVVIERDLPKINGFEVYKRVTTKTKMKETRFIFVYPKHEEAPVNPVSLCGAPLLIQDNLISETLMGKINEIQGMR